MRLTMWTYEGPPHVGAMRIASSLRGVHFVLHAPQGDTYADLLFTMIERQGRRPPVSYTTFQARDLGGDTAQLVLDSVRAAAERFKPDLLLVGESCTAELLQDQPGTLTSQLDLGMPIVPLELPAYSRKENWGAGETLYQIVRAVLKGAAVPERPPAETQPQVNLVGPADLSFRARDNALEVRRLLESVGVRVNVVAPLGAGVSDLQRLPEAHANVSLYPEVSDMVCRWLERQFGQTTVRTIPIGVQGTRRFLQELSEALGVSLEADESLLRAPWYSRSVDSNYLNGKRVYIFGDATHACAAARVARDELGFDVVGLGTYSREQARAVRSLAKEFDLEPLITDNYLEVEQAIEAAAPELILGSQMERNIAKRLGVPCAVICGPFHVEDCPARFSPTMGFEGANVLFDAWVHPLMMGLEEHLLGMFKEDFEFAAGPSHLGASHLGDVTPVAAAAEDNAEAADGIPAWTAAATAELKRIPFFVRRKAAQNTETFAKERGLLSIEVETLYDAKAYFAK